MKWTFKKKFESGETVINTKRFMGYDKDEYGELIINDDEAEIIKVIFDLYMKGYGAFRIAKRLNNEGVKTVTGSKWSDTAILNMLKNEKYKGDYLLQKYYVPENKRKETKPNRGELQSYYIKDNHPGIVTSEIWDKVQEIISDRRDIKHIESGAANNKYQNRYPLSGKLLCPLCGNTLKRRTSYKKQIEWWWSKYILEGKEVCKGIKIKDDMIKHDTFNEPMAFEKEQRNGKKYYRYTSKEEYFKCTGE